MTEEQEIWKVNRSKTRKYLKGNLQSQKKLKKELKRLEIEQKEYKHELTFTKK